MIIIIKSGYYLDENLINLQVIKNKIYHLKPRYDAAPNYILSQFQ